MDERSAEGFTDDEITHVFKAIASGNTEIDALFRWKKNDGLFPPIEKLGRTILAAQASEAQTLWRAI